MRLSFRRSFSGRADGPAFAQAPSLRITLLLVLLAVMAFQGSRGLYETTEGRYAECAREMTVSGNYLEPTLHFQPHWTKPPLAYWSIAAGLRLFGTNTWGARAMLVPAFVLTVLAMGVLGQLLWNPATGRWTALIYATSLFPLVTTNVLSTDVLLTCFIAWALVAFWKGLRTGKRLFFVLMWAAFGAAFLTKGPPSLLFLLGVVPTWFLYRRREPVTPGLVPPGGIAVFIIIGLGWYLYEAWVHPGLASYWLGYETLGRLTDHTGEFHNSGWTRAFTLYGQVLVGGVLPWGALVVPWKKLFLRRRVPRFGALFSSRERAFLVLTFVPVLTVFAIARSKLPLYVLPLFIPLALAMGREMAKAVEAGRRRGPTMLKVALATLLFVVALKGTAGYLTENSGDMKTLSRRLNAAMTKETTEEADLAVLSHRKLYGLDFYENRVLPRAFLPGGDSNGPLPGQVRVTGEPGRETALLVEHRDLKALEEHLGPLSGSQTVSLTERWDLLLFRGLAPESESRTGTGATGPEKGTF